MPPELAATVSSGPWRLDRYVNLTAHSRCRGNLQFNSVLSSRLGVLGNLSHRLAAKQAARVQYVSIPRPADVWRPWKASASRGRLCPQLPGS